MILSLSFNIWIINVTYKCLYLLDVNFLFSHDFLFFFHFLFSLRYFSFPCVYSVAFCVSNLWDFCFFFVVDAPLSPFDKCIKTENTNALIWTFLFSFLDKINWIHYSSLDSCLEIVLVLIYISVCGGALVWYVNVCICCVNVNEFECQSRERKCEKKNFLVAIWIKRSSFKHFETVLTNAAHMKVFETRNKGAFLRIFN